MKKTAIKISRKNKVGSNRNAFNIAFISVCIIVLVLYTLSLVISFGWGISTSFKDYLMDYKNNKMGLPNPFIIQNYIDILQNFSVATQTHTAYAGEMILNSILYAVGCALFQTVACCLMAYIVSRYDNIISRIVYVVVLVVMVLPIVGQLPSEVQMLTNLGLYDNFLGVYLLSFNFLGIHFLIFHAMFKAIPRDYNEAAQIDGAGHWRIFLTIMLPLAKLTFLTVFILKFIVYWNEYQTVLIYMPNHPVLAYGLFKISQGGNASVTGGASFGTVPHKLAGSIIVFMPILILFIAFHKRLIGNVSMGGIKG